MIYKLEERILFDGALPVDVATVDYTVDGESVSTELTADNLQTAIDDADSGSEISFTWDGTSEGDGYEISDTDNDGTTELVITIDQSLTFGPKSVTINGDISNIGDGADLILDGGWNDGANGDNADGIWQDGEGGTQIIVVENNLQGSTISLTNLTLTHGAAHGAGLTDTATSSNKGGAICVEPSGGDAFISLTNVTISDNVAEGNGGAVFIKGHSPRRGGSSIAQLTVDDSLFSNNSSQSNGGAIFSNGKKGALDISDTLFISNSAREGGAIYGQDGRLVTALALDHCTFYDNEAEQGGALFLNYSTPNKSERTEICFSTFAGNRATETDNQGFTKGDAIFHNHSMLRMKNCIVADSDMEGTADNHYAYYNFDGANNRPYIYNQNGWGETNLIESQTDLADKENYTVDGVSGQTLWRTFKAGDTQLETDPGLSFNFTQNIFQQEADSILNAVDTALYGTGKLFISSAADTTETESRDSYVIPIPPSSVISENTAAEAISYTEITINQYQPTHLITYTQSARTFNESDAFHNDSQLLNSAFSVTPADNDLPQLKTYDELREMGLPVNQIDSDGDGIITEEEMDNYLKSLGVNSNEEHTLNLYGPHTLAESNQRLFPSEFDRAINKMAINK